MYIGARILKTGLAVALAMFICNLLNIGTAVFAGITVLVNMQPSVNRSLKNAWEQILVHVIGVLLALFLALTLGANVLVIALAVIIMIVICNKLGWSSAISLGILSVLFILDAPQTEFLSHAGYRSAAIFIGLGIALIVNRVLAPPKYKQKLKEELEKHFMDTAAYFRKSIYTYIEADTLLSYEEKKPLVLETKLKEVNELFERAREEFVADDNVKLMEKMLEICHGFIERGQNISEMTSQRVKRRQTSKAPSQSVSPEFKAILGVLNEGANNLETLKNKVIVGINEKHKSTEMTEHDEYWNRFGTAIDQWQKALTDVYYLRAMMEVVVVATEIRWAARRLKRLHQISATE